MAKNQMVGEEDVDFPNPLNVLEKGAGEIAPLMQKGNFERFPHPIPLPDCARQLARLRPAVEPEKRALVSTLAEQCKRFHTNPDGLRPMMLELINAIENAA